MIDIWKILFHVIDKFGENSDLLCIMFTFITIGLCIFYFTASSASPSPQGIVIIHAIAAFQIVNYVETDEKK